MAKGDKFVKEVDGENVREYLLLLRQKEKDQPFLSFFCKSPIRATIVSSLIYNDIIYFTYLISLDFCTQILYHHCCQHFSLAKITHVLHRMLIKRYT